MKFLLLLFLAALSLIHAHVTVSPTQVPATGTTLLTFNIGHSCATDALTYKMVFLFPQNITSVKPVWKAGWTLNQTSVMLGYKTSAGVDAFRLVFTFTAQPGYEVPTWAVDTMLFRVTAPTGAAAWSIGSMFAIPVYQYCTGGLLDAWNTTTTSSSDSGPLPAPWFQITDVNAIQQQPTQANVVALAAQIAALSSSSSTSTSSSSSWLRADTISVIAIILAGLSIFSSMVLITRLQRVEKQNLILRQKVAAHPSNDTYPNKAMEMSPSHTTSTSTSTPGAPPAAAAPASAPTSVPTSVPASAPVPDTTTRPSTSEGHEDEETEKPQFRFHEA